MYHYVLTKKYRVAFMAKDAADAKLLGERALSHCLDGEYELVCEETGDEEQW